MLIEDNKLYDTILNDFELVDIQKVLDVVLEKARYFGLTPDDYHAPLRTKPLRVLESRDKEVVFSIYEIDKKAIKAMYSENNLFFPNGEHWVEYGKLGTYCFFDKYYNVLFNVSSSNYDIGIEENIYEKIARSISVSTPEYHEIFANLSELHKDINAFREMYEAFYDILSIYDISTDKRVLLSKDYQSNYQDAIKYGVDKLLTDETRKFLESSDDNNLKLKRLSKECNLIVYIFETAYYKDIKPVIKSIYNPSGFKWDSWSDD